MPRAKIITAIVELLLTSTYNIGGMSEQLLVRLTKQNSSRETYSPTRRYTKKRTSGQDGGANSQINHQSCCVTFRQKIMTPEKRTLLHDDTQGK